MATDLKYYRWQVIRQIPVFICVAALVAAATWAIMQWLPPKYAPAARLLMSATSVSQDATNPSDAGGAAHLQNIETRLMTQMRLRAFAQELAAPMDPDAFRDAIDFDIQSGRGVSTTLTVTVSSSDAGFATAAANRLATEVLNEHRKIKTERAEDALSFFRQEVASSEARLDQKYAALEAFLATNVGSLPNDAAKYQDQRKDLLTRLGVKPEPTQRAAIRKRLEAELDSVRAIYSDQHPNVQTLRSRIAELDPVSADPNASLAARALTELDTLLAQIPMNALALQALERDHQRAEAQYETAITRLESAAIGQRIALRTESDQLTIVERAIRPETPEGPQQKIILALGGALALILASVAAAILARSDKYIRRPKDLQTGLGLTPYAVLPNMRPA